MLAVSSLKKNVNFDMKVLWNGLVAWEFGEGLKTSCNKETACYKMLQRALTCYMKNRVYEICQIFPQILPSHHVYSCLFINISQIICGKVHSPL